MVGQTIYLSILIPQPSWIHIILSEPIALSLTEIYSNCPWLSGREAATRRIPIKTTHSPFDPQELIDLVNFQLTRQSAWDRIYVWVMLTLKQLTWVRVFSRKVRKNAKKWNFAIFITVCDCASYWKIGKRILRKNNIFSTVYKQPDGSSDSISGFFEKERFRELCPVGYYYGSYISYLCHIVKLKIEELPQKPRLPISSAAHSTGFCLFCFQPRGFVSVRFANHASRVTACVGPIQDTLLPRALFIHPFRGFVVDYAVSVSLHFSKETERDSVPLWRTTENSPAFPRNSVFKKSHRDDR